MRSRRETNYDLLVSMTPEELAHTINSLFCACDFRSPADVLNWLNSPAEEDER